LRRPSFSQTALQLQHGAARENQICCHDWNLHQAARGVPQEMFAISAKRIYLSVIIEQITLELLSKSSDSISSARFDAFENYNLE
jgi:hypothetical protein